MPTGRGPDPAFRRPAWLLARSFRIAGRASRASCRDSYSVCSARRRVPQPQRRTRRPQTDNRPPSVRCPNHATPVQTPPGLCRSDCLALSRRWRQSWLPKASRHRQGSAAMWANTWVRALEQGGIVVPRRVRRGGSVGRAYPYAPAGGTPARSLGQQVGGRAMCTWTLNTC
jgi:hypothetical protein